MSEIEREELKKEIAELRAKVEYYEGLPSAQFYNSLMKGIDYLRNEVDGESLDFDEDPFAKSVLVLAEKSDKIFSAISKGVLTFSSEKEDDTKKKALKKTGNQVAI